MDRLRSLRRDGDRRGRAAAGADRFTSTHVEGATLLVDRNQRYPPDAIDEFRGRAEGLNQLVDWCQDVRPMTLAAQ